MKITYMDHNHFWQRGVPGRDLIDLGEAHALFDEPYTIEKYIQYYKNVAKRAEGRFHAVGDFTNHNWYLPESFLLELRQEMKKHFDNIRVTCQLRDPIRRYFSRVGKRTSHYTEGQHQFDPDQSHIKNFQEVLMNGKNSRHGTMPRSDDMNRLTLKHNDWKMAHYVQGIQKFERVFGKENVYPIIMEEFWDESRKEEQCKKLSDFLQYPITKIHQNVYVPDRGSNPPLVPELEDQHSDKEDMTPELYEWALKYMGFFYDDWEEAYGSIPKYWKC